MDCYKYITFIQNTTQELVNIDPVQLSNFEKQLKKIISRISDPYLNLALIGDFSSGKSTFINAVTGIDILRTGWLATTAVPAKIYRSSEVAVNVIDTEGYKYSLSDAAQKKELEKKIKIDLSPDLLECFDFLSISNELTGILKYIELYINSDYLENNICIIDTPGVNPGADGTTEHVSITRNVLSEYADMTIVLFPASQVYRDSFVKFLKDNAQRFIDEAIFVITMLDTIDESEQNEVIEFVKKNLIEQFELRFPRVYGCAAKYALSENSNNTEQRWQVEFCQMREEIFQHIKQHRDSIIAGQLIKLLENLLEELDFEVKCSTERIKNDLTILEKNNLDHLRLEIEKCLKNADFDFRSERIDAEKEVMDDFKKYIKKTKKKIKSDISKIDYIKKDENGSISHYCKHKLKKRLKKLNKKINNSAEDAVDDMCLICEKFYSEANAVLNRYQMNLNQMTANESRSFDKIKLIDTIKLKPDPDTETKSIGETPNVVVKKVEIALKTIDSFFNTELVGSFKKLLNSIGFGTPDNTYNTAALDKARKETYKAISDQLDNMYYEKKSKLEKKLRKTLDKMCADMNKAIRRYMAKYKDIFEKKQREYDDNAADLQQLIQNNSMRSVEITLHLNELKNAAIEYRMREV